MRLKLWLKYSDGREYVEYRKTNTVVPEDVQLSDLVRQARLAGNRVVDSSWTCVEEVAK